MRTLKNIANAQGFVDELFRLAQHFEGQPVAIISTDEGLQVGVMSLANPQPDDWFFQPVSVDKFNVEPAAESTDQ